jgi:hypothetical protein
MVVVQAALAVLGIALVLATIRSAVRTVVVPRGEQATLTRLVFLATHTLFDLLARHKRTAEGRDASLAHFAPAALLALAASWSLLTIVGLAPVYWALGEASLLDGLAVSGSSFTTLGFVAPASEIERVAAVIEALIGLGLIALLISFLPTIYSLFSRREAEVVKLDVRAGSPPTALTFLRRFHQIGWLDELDRQWEVFEQWFSELEESHTSYPSLVYYRSQRPDSSWITCAGAVLDTAGLAVSALDLPPSPQATVTVRSGFLALRAIASYFAIPFDPDPAPNDPISVYRGEFELLLDELAAAGLPVKADRNAAWRDFAGWRVNYDAPLLGLCALVEAPSTPWSADRVERFHRPTLLRRRWVIEPMDNPPSW